MFMKLEMLIVLKKKIKMYIFIKDYSKIYNINIYYTKILWKKTRTKT